MKIERPKGYISADNGQGMGVPRQCRCGGEIVIGILSRTPQLGLQWKCCECEVSYGPAHG